VKDDQVCLLHVRDACTRILDYTTGGRDAQPDVPWKRMAGMRDRVIHAYFGVDLDLVWEVVETHVPDLKRRVEGLLAPRPAL